MKVQGGLGSVNVYATYTASTISFHENTPDPDTIEDSAEGFLTAGFVVGMTVAISGSGGGTNDKDVTIDALTAGVMTLTASDDITEEEASESITLATPAYGYQVLGFRDWSGVNGIDIVDSTCFEDYPFKRHTTTLKDWSASLNGFWLSTERDSWLGRTLHLRLFHRFASSPSATDPAMYWSGDGIIEGVPEGIPVDSLVTQTITVQGDNTLSENVKTDSW